MGGHQLKVNPLSPSGGWNFIPKNWRANTAVVAVGIVAVSIATWQLGERSTVVQNKQYDDETIARWNAAARKARESSAITKVSGEQ